MTTSGSSAASTSKARRYRPRAAEDMRVIRRSPRDDAIIEAVGDHRFIETSSVCGLLAERFHPERTRHRLRALFDHGLLYKVDQPRYLRVEGGGSRPDIYALTDEGAALYQSICGLQPRGRLRLRERNLSLKDTEYIEHQLLITRVLVAIERACNALEGISFVRVRDITLPDQTKAERRPFAWRVEIEARGRRETLAIEPDALFGIRDERAGEQRTAWFFLEADRGTMDIEPRAFGPHRKSSIAQKFAAYVATLQQGLHTRRFGFKRFRVLTVTSRTDERLTHMMAVARKLVRDDSLARHFLFATEAALLEEEALYRPWRNATGAATMLIAKEAVSDGRA